MLLLDEPTNHLDLRAKDVLLDAIRNFTGTVLFVSHDRYFIDGLATRVFEVEDRRVHIYPGNYEDYLWRKQGGPEKVTASVTHPAPVVSATTVDTPDDTLEPSKPPVKRLNPIKLKQLEDRLQFTETEIPRLEEAIAAAEEKLGIFSSAEQSQRLAAEIETMKQQQGTLLAEWEELTGQLEEQQSA